MNSTVVQKHLMNNVDSIVSKAFVDFKSPEVIVELPKMKISGTKQVFKYKPISEVEYELLESILETKRFIERYTRWLADSKRKLIKANKALDVFYEQFNDMHFYPQSWDKWQDKFDATKRKVLGHSNQVLEYEQQLANLNAHLVHSEDCLQKLR